MPFLTTRGANRLSDTAKSPFLTTTLKMLLLKSTFVPAKTDKTVNTINANEISVAGYVGAFGGAGRKALATKTLTEDDVGFRLQLGIANLVWSALGAGARIGVGAVVHEITDDSGSQIIGYADLNGQGVVVTAATNANPASLTAVAHGLATGDVVTITGAAGGTWSTLNARRAITVVDANTFTVNGFDGTALGVYTASSCIVARPFITNGGDFTLQVNAAGLWVLNV